MVVKYIRICQIYLFINYLFIHGIYLLDAICVSNIVIGTEGTDSVRLESFFQGVIVSWRKRTNVFHKYT